VTLLDAGEYIAALPKKEHAAPEWQGIRPVKAALPNEACC
jgi:hypothetical protein